MVGVRFSVWLVSGYSHVFVLLSVVIVTYPFASSMILLTELDGNATTIR